MTKEINKQNKNVLSISTKQEFKKPEDPRAYQKLSQSTLEEVTPSRLKQFIELGHSFHIGAFRASEKGSFTNAGILFANVFAIDIDHHSFTIEEIIERCVVKPNLIYRTHSYTEENKRYRVVFFSKTTLSRKNIPNLEEVVKRVQICLTAPFLKDLSDDVLSFSDTSAVNAGRLFFGGNNVTIVSETVDFDVYEFLNDKETVKDLEGVWNRTEQLVSKLRKTKNLIDKFRTFLSEKDAQRFDEIRKVKTPEAYREIMKIFSRLSEKVEIDAPGVKPKKKGKKEVKPVCTPEERPLYSTMINQVLEGLSDYRVGEEGTTTLMAYDEALRYLKTLPFHEMLGYELEQPIKALMRNENNPSAAFLEAKNGTIIYHDFADRSTTALHLIAEMMEIEYGYIFEQVVQDMCDRLGIVRASEYKLTANAQLSASWDWVHDITEGTRRHKAKSVFSYGLGRFYMGLNLVSSKIISPYCLLENRHGVVVYRSLEELHKELLTGYYGEISEMKIKSYMGFFNKISMLVYLGFISKVDPSELIPEKRAGLQLHRSQSREILGVSEADYRHPNFYEFHPITNELLETALERYNTYKKNGGTLANMCHETLFHMDKEEAQRVFPQNRKKKLNKHEQEFYTAVSRKALKLINKQGYFTEEEVLTGILQQNEWFNGKKRDKKVTERYQKAHKEKPRSNAEVGYERRQKALVKLRAQLMTELGITSVTGSQVTGIELPKTITHRHRVYVRTSNVK